MNDIIINDDINYRNKNYYVGNYAIAQYEYYKWMEFLFQSGMVCWW